MINHIRNNQLMGCKPFLFVYMFISLITWVQATSLRHHPINERQSETLKKKRDGMSQEVIYI